VSVQHVATPRTTKSIDILGNPNIGKEPGGPPALPSPR
jgi:hypothetical protein